MPDQGEQPRNGPGAGDETRRLPSSDETRPLPAPGPDRTTGEARPVWSGRAEVPPPSTAHLRGPAPEQWQVVERPPGRPWWMPILLGILAVALLSAIAIGLWLIAQSAGDGDRTPTPPATTAAPTTPSVAATSAAPTSAAATTAAPAVVVPPVVGLPEATAQTVLDQLGLAYRLRFRDSDQPPGTVIATDPEVGARVSAGTVVTLVIARAPTAPPTTPSQPATTATPDD